MNNKLESRSLDHRLLNLTVILLSCSVLPHLLNLRFEIVAIFLFLASWRVVSQSVRKLPTTKLILYLFAAVGFTITVWFYGPPVGRDPGISFLIVMLGLKLFETRTRRDIRVLMVLGYFMVITHFLYQGSFVIVFPMLGLVAGFTWLMMQMEHVTPSGKGIADLKLVGKILLQALPFAIILFFLFPRLAGQFWLLELGNNDGISGVSDKLSMGSISNLVESKEVAFVATFDDEVPPRTDWYWRGGVLWETDGREWVSGEDLLDVDYTETEFDGGGYQYQVTLEPTKQKWLFALDVPTSIPESATLHGDYHLSVPEKIERTFNYSLSSISDVTIKTISDEQMTKGLDLPNEVITPRMHELTQRFRQQSKGDDEFANRVLQHFNRNEFSYTLQPPLLLSNKPVDEFLFESQQGFCGHYASTFATLMRMENIPSRLVVGYLGGEFNPRANQITVRQSEAHAWTEIWLEDRGWVRVDPTAAIAPERVENPINYDLSNQSDGLVRFSSVQLGALGSFLREARWQVELVKMQWQRWFVGFNHQRQKEMLDNLGLGDLELKNVAILAFLLGVAVLMVIAFSLFSFERKKQDAVLAAYQLFCRKLFKQGLDRLPFEGPEDFSQRAEKQFPDKRKELQLIKDHYISLRYGKKCDDMGIKKFKILVDQFSI